MRLFNQDLPTKLKLVYVPYALALVGTVAGYTGLRWLLDIELELLHVKEDILDLWIPFAIPWLTILIFLRKPLKILAIKGKRDNGHFLYQMAMWGSMVAPLVVSQQYLVNVSYDLQEISTADKVIELPSERFFQLDEYSVEKDWLVPYYRANVSGKHNQYLNFHIYYACPFTDGDYTVWVGYHETERVSNGGLSDAEKDDAFEAFAEKVWNEFADHDFGKAVYFKRVSFSDQLDGYHESIIKSSVYNEQPLEKHVVLEAVTEPFEARLGSKFAWIFYWLGIDLLILFIMIGIPNIDQEAYLVYQGKRKGESDELMETIAFLNPLGEHKVGAILIWSNILVFLWMLYEGASFIHPTASDLLELGGNRRTEVLNGEYWRLLTSVFMHSGIMHLALNMFGLGLAMVIVDRKLSAPALILAYLFTGVVASGASIWWHENTVSVGASGAIFGLFGLIAAFNAFKVFGKDGTVFIWGLLAVYAGLSLVMGFFGNADNAAHIGGLVAGFVTGIALLPLVKDKG